MRDAPFLTLNHPVLWLKFLLTAATLGFLYIRHRAARTARGSTQPLPHRSKLFIALAVAFSFAVFHNLGTFRGGSFVHYAEMFHYYLGSKYFRELGYYELYNAVIVADTEQGNALASQPFYTDLRTYQKAQRETTLRDVDRIKNLFSEARWAAFKHDVAHFRRMTDQPNMPGLVFILMDHGYNGSPVSTFVLGILTNLFPVEQLSLLAFIDVLLVVAMVALVFRTFGFEMGAVFSVYFFANILSGQEYVSGSLLRYDWLLYIVLAVCLLEKGRYAPSAFFLTLSAMLRIFPAMLLYGIAVAIYRNVRSAGTVDRKYVRFGVAAAVTAVGLFVLPATTLGSVLQPWKDFYSKTELHDSGVYVNHLGLRGMLLFEPSQLSLESFVATFKSAHTDDIVRQWQDLKEHEFRGKRLIIVLTSLLVLACVTAIVWKGRESEWESGLWCLLLVYTASYLSHYYYAFLCLFVLLFFRRVGSARGFVPLCLLLCMNLAALVTDSFKPSPIVFYTSTNIYLFFCVSAILGLALYTRLVHGAAAPERSSDSGGPRKENKRRRSARPKRR